MLYHLINSLSTSLINEVDKELEIAMLTTGNHPNLIFQKL
jgi:hypothetical protein